MKQASVAIAGAGLTGALAAIRIAERGHEVTVYERRRDPRLGRAEAGRSINLAISTRGLDALSRAGLDGPVRESGVAMFGRAIHGRGGGVTHQPYSSDRNNHLLSVDRDLLNTTLLDACDGRRGVTLCFGHKLVDLDIDSATVRLQHDGTDRSATHDVILGADGAYSGVRSRMQRTERFAYEQEYLEHGYKELTIHPAADGSPRLDPHALHIWPRGGHMMIALANPDNSFTCTLFWPFDGPSGFSTIDTPDEVLEIFGRDFVDAAAVIDDLTEQYLSHPTSSLVTIRCSPWTLGGRVLVIGDAAHAVVPFYGQGANAALEDVTLLVEELERHDDDFATAFTSFSNARKPDADALAELALDNFIEMRDRVATRRFRLDAAARRMLHRWFPTQFVPLYEMVTFSRTPYARARDRAKQQDRRLRVLVLGAVLVTVGLVVAILVGLPVLLGARTQP